MLAMMHCNGAKPFHIDTIIKKSVNSAKAYLRKSSNGWISKKQAKPKFYDEFKMHIKSATLAELELEDYHRYGYYTFKTVGAGFWALRQTDFREALQSIVREAGDATANGAVAGSLLGCKLGFKEIKRTVPSWVYGLKHRKWLNDKIKDFLGVAFPHWKKHVEQWLAEEEGTPIITLLNTDNKDDQRLKDKTTKGKTGQHSPEHTAENETTETGASDDTEQEYGTISKNENTKGETEVHSQDSMTEEVHTNRRNNEGNCEHINRKDEREETQVKKQYNDDKHKTDEREVDLGGQDKRKFNDSNNEQSTAETSWQLSSTWTAGERSENIVGEQAQGNLEDEETNLKTLNHVALRTVSAASTTTCTTLGITQSCSSPEHVFETNCHLYIQDLNEEICQAINNCQPNTFELAQAIGIPTHTSAMSAQNIMKYLLCGTLTDHKMKQWEKFIQYFRCLPEVPAWLGRLEETLGVWYSIDDPQLRIYSGEFVNGELIGVALGLRLITCKLIRQDNLSSTVCCNLDILVNARNHHLAMHGYSLQSLKQFHSLLKSAFLSNNCGNIVNMCAPNKFPNRGSSQTNDMSLDQSLTTYPLPESAKSSRPMHE